MEWLGSSSSIWEMARARFVGSIKINPAVIYGLFSGTTIWRKVDGGMTWAFQGTTPQCCGHEIFADPLDANTAYVLHPNSSIIKKSGRA